MIPQGGYEFRSLKGQVCVPLYKYYANYDYAKDAINNQRIHLESPSEYNDVYDSAFYLTATTLKRMYNTSHNICNILKNLLSAKYRLAIEKCYSQVDKSQFSVYDVIEFICSFDNNFVREELIEECICNITHNNLLQANNNKITCFSERNNSLLMWAYYANNAQGVCLGFDIKSDYLLNLHCHKVQYSDCFVLDEPGFDGYFRKSEQWSHEQEWRIVCDTTEDYIPTKSLKMIILGCRTPSEICSDFLALGKEKGLDVYRIKPSIEKYELLLEPLHICNG